jgi:hypothetical protein
MTAFDRIEPRLPELMTSLAAASVPDYIDDMLQAAAQTHQRPAWRSLERWLPMGVTALSVPNRRMPWRYLVIATALLLIAVASLYYAGSRRTPLPPPFGPARNGVIVYGTGDGEIASMDPVTGATRVLIGGASTEQYPTFSNDGTRLVFARTSGTTETDFAAGADGSNVRDLLPSGPTIQWWDESASGDRAIVARDVDGPRVISIVEMATGRETPLATDPALGIDLAMFRPGHDEIIYEHVPSDGLSGTKVYIGPGDGTGTLREVKVADAASEAWPSPDGSRLVYTTWGATEPEHGRVHVLDLDTGIDTPLMFEGSEGTNELSPKFSPDGKQLVLRRFGADGDQVTIVPVDGVGPAIGVGPRYPNGGAETLWSPDGTQVLAAYGTNGSVWLLPTNGDPGRQLDGLSWDRGITWQRLAP